MNILNPNDLKRAASYVLSRGRDPKKLVLAFSGITLAVYVLVLLADFAVARRLSTAVGLSNLGTNSILTTVQMLLPLAQSFALMCLELGYQHGMLRITRLQYADHTDLREGFRRFGPLLRYSLLQGGILFLLGMVVIYPCIFLFLLTPWSNDFWALAQSMPETGAVIDDAMVMAIMDAAMPLTLLFGIVFPIVSLPVQYHLRMANYILADEPRKGAFAALTGSFRMMRRNCLNMFKVDLRLWWYHAAIALLTVVAYLNQLLPLVGVALPWSDDASFYIFSGIYAVGLFAVYYFLRNPAEMVYIQAYQRLRPREPRPQGVVLGNIFQM